MMCCVYVHVSAFGCSNPTPPTNGLIDRQGDRAYITCASNSFQWEIVCREGAWHGDFGKCAESKFSHEYLYGKREYTVTCRKLNTFWSMKIWPIINEVSTHYDISRHRSIYLYKQAKAVKHVPYAKRTKQMIKLYSKNGLDTCSKWFVHGTINTTKTICS